MFLVGLTGGIGTGKSTVSNYFRQQNVPLIDADLIAREVVEPGKPAWKRLRASFGDDFFDPITGALDRKKLGDLIFGSISLRRKLNSIVHPYIRWEITKRLFVLFFTGHQFVILDLPLLFESGWQRILQYVIVVKCNEENQLQRLMARDSSTENEAKQRIKAQMPLETKEKSADFVVDNDGTMDETLRQAANIFAELSSSRRHWWFRFIFIVGAAVFASVTFAIVKRVTDF